ncbi:MFS transporter [Cordyceps militaris CM01]|uniref:MFS transporter n=1 Tax=Cordyceps militaris (strain CM01) TaxID=983644 RepID=G3JGY6_CORMM|nr:MFS transporter [Cordyceps militaris CM01]EGX91542.1 MFS transporter [Cordyceps militaris CM01]
MSGCSADDEAGDDRAPRDRRIRDLGELQETENTPLLPTDRPAELVPEPSLRLLVSLIGGLCLTLVAVSQRLFGPALQEIMEDVICRNVYRDHQLNALSPPDSRCKENDVQKVLSMVSAVDVSAEMIVPIMVQIPFGIIADKYGRRIVIFASLFGCFLKIAWTILVLSLPDKLNIWAILWGNLAYFLGGGGSMAGAMCYTLFSDVTPAAERTMVFYQLNAVLRIVNVAATPLAAFLLGVNPWIALYIGIGLLGIGTVCTLLLPETLDLRKVAEQRRLPRERAEEFAPQPISKVSAKSAIQRALASARSDFAHIWRFLLGSQGIMLLMVCNALVYPLKLVFDSDLLQYMTKRYHWSWSTATYIVSIENFFALGVLMIVLPTTAWALNRRGRSPLQRDLFIARVSAIFAFLGTILIAFAPVGWLCLLALIIYSFATGFSPLFRSILSIIVEPHTIGALNTVIATTESIVGLVSAPTLAWLLNRGMDIGGVWIGLPFMFTALLTALSALGIFLFKLPTVFVRS